ncbi:DUF559 domain-containing protein [bacterium]|nr:DUF559 domain-containing protein [bacterium]
MKCRICNKQVGSHGIGYHTKKVHSIDYKTKYIPKFFDDYPNDFPSYRKCVMCDNISWHKNCSKKCGIEYKKKFLVGKNSPRYGKQVLQETRDKISNTHKKKIKMEGSWRLGKIHSKESKIKMGKTRVMRGLSKGKNNPMYGKTHTPEAIEKIMSKRPMNTLETLVSNLFIDNNILYYYQYFLSRNGVCKSYDFKIKGTNILIEVDGDYWHGGPNSNKYKPFHRLDETKANDTFKDKFAKKHGFKVYRFWESEIKKNPNIILEKLK